MSLKIHDKNVCQMVKPHIIIHIVQIKVE